MTIEVLPSLDLPVLLNNHVGTFSTHIIPEATSMTRITFAITALLSLAFTPLAAQDFNKGAQAFYEGDYQVALQEWLPLAGQGDVNAQYVVGEMYRLGQGVILDYSEALKWYRLAAEQRLAPAQYTLGTMYRKGEGVHQDDREAVKWFLHASVQGYSPAQTKLGYMYAQGFGVPQNLLLSYMWSNISNLSGDDQAKKNRDLVALMMTTEDVSTAWDMTSECMGSNYQNCGY